MIPEVFGTVPGWITAIVSSGGFIAWLKYLIDKRRIEGDRLGDLEKENRQLRTDFDTYRRECIAESEKQRELIDGLRRQVMQLEARQIEEMAERLPPATREKFVGK